MSSILNSSKLINTLYENDNDNVITNKYNI